MPHPPKISMIPPRWGKLSSPRRGARKMRRRFPPASRCWAPRRWKIATLNTNTDKWSVLRLSGKVAVNDTLTITPAFYGEWEKTDDTAVFFPEVGLYQQQKEVQEPY